MQTTEIVWNRYKTIDFTTFLGMYNISVEIAKNNSGGTLRDISVTSAGHRAGHCGTSAGHLRVTPHDFCRIPHEMLWIWRFLMFLNDFWWIERYSHENHNFQWILHIYYHSQWNQWFQRKCATIWHNQTKHMIFNVSEPFWMNFCVQVIKHVNDTHD